MYKWTASWFNHYCTGILSTITKISKAVQFWSEFLGKVELYQTPCLPSFKYHHTLQMVREYKRKSPAPKWSSFESMSEALVSVIFGAMPMWRAVDIWRHTDWKSCWYLETYRCEELLIFGDIPKWRAVDIWRRTDTKSCWYFQGTLRNVSRPNCKNLSCACVRGMWGCQSDESKTSPGN